MIYAIIACIMSAALAITLLSAGIYGGDWIDFAGVVVLAIGVWVNLWALAAALKRVRAS